MTSPKPGRADAGLHEVAEAEGRPEVAAAYRRIGLLTEVWECLRDNSPVAAAELAGFCEETAQRLDGAEEGEAVDISSWALCESASRWGDYLGLIDPGEESAPSPEACDARSQSCDTAEDDPGSLDAAALFRLLTGAPAPSSQPFVERQAKPNQPEVITSRGVELTKASGPGTPPPKLPARPSPGVDPVPPASPVVSPIDPDLRDTFLAEASDLFDRIEGLVVGLEGAAQSAESMDEIGRCIHTLKGAAGSVGLTQVVHHLHELEGRIDAAAGQASGSIVDDLHESLRFLEGAFRALRGGGATEAVALSPDPGPPPPPRPSPSAETPAGPLEAPHPLAARVDSQATEGPVRVSAERIDELMDLVSELIMRRGLWAAQSETMKQFDVVARACRGRLLNTLDRLRDLHPEDRGTYPKVAGRRASDTELDLHGLLRRLSEQTDDLVVLAESARDAAKPLADNSDLLARQTLQLWDALQSIRIVPVKGLFQKLTRVAQDAARFEGRRIEVVTRGEETGLDRAVQDKAYEPLLHVVRNAVCHGIEAAADRAKAGKPEVGKITLEASRAGNTLVLSVQDDGQGLDYEAIAAKGRRLGMIGPDDQPGVERLNALVFQPGFSTRDSANAIAGRGVGMDVVSQEVARLHGSVSLTSTRGNGTRLSISLPARLALEQVMIFQVNGQSFALPVALIDRADEYDPAAELEGRRLRLGKDVVPMITAREALGEPARPSPCPMVLLVRAEGEPLAVRVDGIEGTRELVIKPLASLLSGHPVVSGVGLSVQGEVVFTLNPVGLARWRREAAGPVTTAACNLRDDAPPPVLVVDDSISVRTVAARLLRGFGYEVVEASDGLEALGKLRTGRYSMVLTDLEMPRMDGFELLAELSRLGISPALPVLMASTRSDPETRRKALALGAVDFLPKPINPEALRTKAKELVDASAAASDADVAKEAIARVVPRRPVVL